MILEHIPRPAQRRRFIVGRAKRFPLDIEVEEPPATSLEDLVVTEPVLVRSSVPFVVGVSGRSEVSKVRSRRTGLVLFDLVLVVTQRYRIRDYAVEQVKAGERCGPLGTRSR